MPNFVILQNCVYCTAYSCFSVQNTQFSLVCYSTLHKKIRQPHMAVGFLLIPLWSIP